MKSASICEFDTQQTLVCVVVGQAKRKADQVIWTPYVHVWWLEDFKNGGMMDRLLAAKNKSLTSTTDE